MVNEKLLLSKTFSNQLNIGSALSSFIEEIIVVFGKGVTVVDRKPLTFSEYFYVELISFSNGCQVRTSLRRDSVTLDIEALAFSEPNQAYLSKLENEELSIMCSLVKKEWAKMVNRKYSEVNQQELDIITSLMSKLKIITGEIL